MASARSSTKSDLHCLMTDGCLFILLIVDSRLRMLPTPLLRPVVLSSLMILWVGGRFFGRAAFGSVPALNCISSRKLSLSEAKLSQCYIEVGITQSRPAHWYTSYRSTASVACSQ